jgi:GGDEF domain-containing protein
MFIDEDAFNNSTFTLMSSEELSSFSHEKEVKALLQKYEVIKEVNHLTNSAESYYVAMMNYINDLYYLNTQIPNDIQTLLQTNITFKEYLLNNVSKRLKGLTQNGSAIFFKEIVAIVNLLSMGNRFHVFKNYNVYDFDEIAKLFRFYEDLLRNQFLDDKKNFESTFSCYTKLIQAYNKLCVINSTDLQRRKSITPIMDLITESINMLKFTIAFEETHLNKINNVLGEILYYFAHLPYIETKDKELYYLIDEFYLLLEKQTDGYNLSKDAGFGEDVEHKEEEYHIFVNYSANLLLNMLQKLAFAFKDEDYFNTRSFQKCLTLFAENFPTMGVIPGKETLEGFRDKLLFALVQNYALGETSIGDIKTHKNAIDDFIQSADQFNIHNIETIHNLLLFAQDIEDYKYLHIGETLIGSPLIKNDYYEFFKLKTIDIVINYFIVNKTKEEIVPFLQKVLTYIENNKKGSHLLSVFSKLYLSIAHYYSTLNDKLSIETANDIYAIFINMNGFGLLKNEYARINKQILIALGQYYAKDLSLNAYWFNDNMLIDLGKKLSSNYLNYQELDLKYKINRKITQLTSEILYEETVNYEEIHTKITNIIANEIFYGLCIVRIKGLTQEKSTIVDNGYTLYSIAMMRDYTIQFIFPSVYEEAFKYILDINKEFIKKNVDNILASFVKNAAAYIDETTGLENFNKLQLDLDSRKNQNITFIEVCLGGFQEINNRYGFAIGHKFLRSIAQKVKTQLQPNDSIYYLGEGRLGIIIGYGNDFNNITQSIFNFKIKKDGREIDMKLTIAVTQSNTSNILRESAQLLDKALISNETLVYNIK